MIRLYLRFFGYLHYRYGGGLLQHSRKLAFKLGREVQDNHECYAAAGRHMQEKFL